MTERTIALEIREGGDTPWIRIASKKIDSPQQGNPYKTVLEDADVDLRVVQEVNIQP